MLGLSLWKERTREQDTTPKNTPWQPKEALEFFFSFDTAYCVVCNGRVQPKMIQEKVPYLCPCSFFPPTSEEHHYNDFNI